ncbi:ATP-binding cassette domain-containing protein, partial [Colwellia sp. TT2012]|uniref:ATP-binding cassette domain-containing protein n=1 Tax=Colwellia sp. TT2012 TaxID=1720342 RepID=UPI0018D206E1
MSLHQVLRQAERSLPSRPERPGGVVYSFLGPNGAGKTTTIKMLIDALKSTYGEIMIFGLGGTVEAEVSEYHQLVLHQNSFRNFVSIYLLVLRRATNMSLHQVLRQ